MQVSMWAIPEGYVVFPKVPLLRIEGPLPIVQLMETTLLNLINYARCHLTIFEFFDTNSPILYVSTKYLVFLKL